MSYVPPLMPAPNPNVLPGMTNLDGVVTAEVPCRKCGYTLRGLPLEGRCPECGRAVGLSVRGDFLRYSDPGWVRNLHRGIRLIIWAVVVIVLGIIVGVALGAALQSPAAAIVPVGAMLVGYVLYLVGTWLLTEPDPSGVGEDQYGTSRKLIRIALALGIVNQVIDIVRQFAPIPDSLRSTLALLTFVFAVAGLVGLFAQLQYLKKLALRIPDQALADRAQFLMYAIGISYGIIIVFGVLVGFLSAPGRPAGPFAALGCVVAITAIALLVFLFMYLRMLERMGKRFNEEAGAAEQTWARVDTGASA